MEYTQWERTLLTQDEEVLVLILVVMEYTQWAIYINVPYSGEYCLNPCCNGIYSMSGAQITDNPNTDKS